MCLVKKYVGNGLDQRTKSEPMPDLLMIFYVMIIVLAILFVIIGFFEWHLGWSNYKSRRKYKHVRWLKRIGLLETGLIIYHYELFDNLED